MKILCNASGTAWKQHNMEALPTPYLLFYNTYYNI